MNTNATSNQTLRDVILFLLGAGLTTGVLLVLYFAFPLGKADSNVVSKDDTLRVLESVEESTPAPSQERQTTGLYHADSLTEILTNHSGTFDRFAALYSLVSQSDEQKLVELFNESETYEYSESDESWLDSSIQRTILSRLIHVNEKLAGSLFLGLESDQQSAISYTFAREFASFDLDRAINFVENLAEDVKFSAVRGILDLNQTLPTEELMTLATRLGNTNYVQNLVDQRLLQEEAENPQQAWATLSSDPSLLTGENWARIQNVLDAWVKEEGVAVIDTITAAIEDEDLKERVVRIGLRTVSEDDPEAAFDYALQFQDEGGGIFGFNYNPHTSSVLNDWVRKQPLDALYKVLSIDSTSQKNQLAETVFRIWASSDIQALVDSIPQFPSEYQDAARVSSISRLSQDSVEDAISLFSDIESDAKKNQAAMTIASSLANTDSDAALHWAQTDPSTESIRTQLISTILTTIASKDPQKAFDVALELPLNEDGEGLEARVITTMAYSNVDKALELLPKVRMGATQRTAYMGVGSGLAMQGRITEAIELGKDLSEEDQLNYYTTVGAMSLSGSLVSGLTGNEPEKDVFETLDSIPHDGARSKVAMQAIIMNQMRDSYSDDEIASLKEYVSEDDMEELEKGLEQMDSMPIPFLGL